VETKNPAGAGFFVSYHLQNLSGYFILAARFAAVGFALLFSFIALRFFGRASFALRFAIGV
jgi:hypothetical protein